MMRRFTRITFIRRIIPEEMSINDELQAFSNALGLVSERDKEKSCFRIFIALLREKQSLSSDEIAHLSNLSRATVIHHLNKLMDAGIVIGNNNKYQLRTHSFAKLVDYLEEDMKTYLRELRRLGEQIDEDLGV